MIGLAIAAQLIATRPQARPAKPRCSPGAICFAGEVHAGQEFRKVLNNNLEFVLKPGWTLEILTRHPDKNGCTEFAAVATPPYHGHRSLDINMSNGVTAQQEAADSPREFSFVTNCVDYRTEFQRLQTVLYPYSFNQQDIANAAAKLGTSPLGKGLLWITEAHVTGKPSVMESMKFSVEIRLPRH